MLACLWKTTHEVWGIGKKRREPVEVIIQNMTQNMTQETELSSIKSVSEEENGQSSKDVQKLLQR